MNKRFSIIIAIVVVVCICVIGLFVVPVDVFPENGGYSFRHIEILGQKLKLNVEQGRYIFDLFSQAKMKGSLSTDNDNGAIIKFSYGLLNDTGQVVSGRYFVIKKNGDSARIYVSGRFPSFLQYEVLEGDFYFKALCQ